MIHREGAARRAGETCAPCGVERATRAASGAIAVVLWSGLMTKSFRALTIAATTGVAVGRRTTRRRTTRRRRSNLFAELFQLPGYLAPGSGLKFADVPAGIAALPTTVGGQGGVPIAGWVQIVFFIGCLETQVFKQDPSKVTKRLFFFLFCFSQRCVVLMDQAIKIKNDKLE